MSEAPEQALRLKWLKAVVIGLGIVFLGLATLLIVLIMTGGPKRTTSAASRVAPPALSEVFEELTLPRNSRIADVMATGNRIILRVRLADGREWLYTYDSETLKPMRTLAVQVEK